MSFTVIKPEKGGAMNVVKLKQRTYRTENGQAVPHNHPSARYLVGPAGASIPQVQADALGLVDGDIVVQEEDDRPGFRKAQGKQEDKALGKQEDKAQGKLKKK